MQGNINFTGNLSGDISGGGGGGSEVTITPTLTSGTKIADFTIDEKTGSLYAPTPHQSVLDVQVNNTQVPDYESIVENNIAKLNLYPYMEKSEAYTMFNLVNDEIVRVDDKVGDLEQIVPYKQDKLTAGNNITIDSNNVISATSGSSWNYSTTPVNTGQKWIDGKPLYAVVLQVNNLQPDSVSPTLLSGVDFYVCTGFTVNQYNDQVKYSPSSISMYNYQGAGTNYAYVVNNSGDLSILNGSRVNYVDATAIVLFTYSS